jgi:hypothetical protein
MPRDMTEVQVSDLRNFKDSSLQNVSHDGFVDLKRSIYTTFPELMTGSNIGTSSKDVSVSQPLHFP